MPHFRLSTIGWRWLICVLTAATAVLLLVDAGYAIHPLLIDKVQGTLGATLNDHIDLHPESYGSYRLTVLEVAANSPLNPHGLKRDDQLMFDRPIDRWRRFQVGEPIGVTLFTRTGTHHAIVVAVPSPVPFAEKFDYIGRLIIALPTLLFAVIVGIKHGDTVAQRALAKAFCALNLLFFIATNYSPGASLLVICKLLGLASYPFVFYWFALFAFRYCDYPPSPLRRILQRCFPWLRAAVFGLAAYSVWYGWGNEARLMLPLTGAVIGAAVVAAMLSGIEGWRQTRGEIRQRHQWLIASFAIAAVPALVSWIPGLDAGIDGASYTMMSMLAGQMCMYAGLAYAVLKHRVFDFNFAVSRMAIFGIISILLLSSFFLAEQMSAKLLHGGGHADAPTATLVIDSMIALTVYLCFHHLHGIVEHWVERFLFRSWHENERRLRQYVRQASHITNTDALLTAFQVALDGFTGNAGCAIYLRQSEQHFTLVAGSIGHAPAQIDINANVALRVRTEAGPLLLDPKFDRMPGELVVPMSHRGALNGFVLIGGKTSGSAYRPDELAVLAFATHETGVDIHALRVDLLERELKGLEQDTLRQRSQLELMAGRRKAPRTTMQPQIEGLI